MRLACLVVGAFAACVLASPLGRAAEQPIGVLLGMRLGASSDDPSDYPVAHRYRTLWIVKSAGVVRLEASANVLVVPRPSGFWRIGSTELKQSKSFSAEWPWISVQPGVPVHAGNLDAGNCQGRSFTQIEFISGEYLAYSYGSKSSCGDKYDESFDPYVARMAELQGQAFSAGADWVEIWTPFGPQGSVALQDAFQRLKKQIRDANVAVGVDPDVIQESQDSLGVEWGLTQQRGVLTAFGYARGFGQDVFVERLPLKASPPAFGRHSRPFAWAAVVKAVPDAIDAFQSPIGDLLIVVTSAEVRAYLRSRPPLGVPALRVPLGQVEDSGEASWWGARRGTAPVMVEWARGGYVAQWSRAVETLGRHAPPQILPK